MTDRLLLQNVMFNYLCEHAQRITGRELVANSVYNKEISVITQGGTGCKRLVYIGRTGMS